MQITRGKIASAQKVVIYGPEGVGKTTFASQFPAPVFVDTEGSTHNIDVARLQKPSSWSMLLEQINYVKKNKPCTTLVIDTIDWAERLCVEHVCEKSKKDSITKFGYGEGFIQLEEEFGRFLNKLTDLIETGINVVLTAHAKISKFEQPDEFGAYDRWELKLGNKTTAKTSALVKEWADMLLFANYKTVSVATDDKGTKFKGQGKKRVMYTDHHPAWDAKNRHGLPEEMPFEYAQIAQCIPCGDAAVSTPAVLTKNQPVNPAVEATSAATTHTTADLDKQLSTIATLVTSDVDNPFNSQNIAQTASPPPHEQTTLATESPQTGASPPPGYMLPPDIPKALSDLMKIHRVEPGELQRVVAQKGYYPIQTPINKYDPAFINGVLVGAWPQVLKVINENRNEPDEAF